MNNPFNIENQAGKRVKNLLLHKATASGIDPGTAKFVISTADKGVAVYLYTTNTLIRKIELREIAEFFGKSFDEAKVAPFRNYLVELAEKNSVPVENLHVIACEVGKEMGCHLYNGSKYIKKISTLEILGRFNSEED